MPTYIDDRIILTHAQVRELANAPDELLSFDEFAEHVYTLPSPSRAFLHSSEEKEPC